MSRRPPDIGLDEIDTAASMVREQADPEANIIWVLPLMKTWKTK